MAGSDMSKNLGGMLSQSAQALGSMGNTYTDSLVKNVQNMTRPDAAPDDIAGQQRLMSWQNKMGRTDAARNTQVSIAQAIQAQKEQKELEGKQNVARAAQSFEEKVLTGTEQEIEDARSALRAAGVAVGMDTTSMAAGIESETARKANQAYAEGERARVAKERERTAKEDGLVDELASGMNSAASVEAVDSLLASADPVVAQQAQVLYNAAVTRIDKNTQRDALERDNKRTIQPTTATIPQGSGEDAERLTSSLLLEQKGLEEAFKDYNTRAATGQVGPTEYSGLMRRRNNFEKRVNDFNSSIVLGDIRTERDLEKQRIAKVAGVGIRKITDKEVKTWIKDNPKQVNTVFDDYYTKEEARAMMRKEAVDTINAEYGYTSENKPPPTRDEIIAEAMLEFPGKSRKDVITKLKERGFIE